MPLCPIPSRARMKAPAIWICPKVQSILQKKVTRSQMPQGSTCFTVDSGSALSGKKLLFSGKRQGYSMKEKEDATNCFARHH